MAVSRFEAEQGVTVRLRTRFERNDNLFDPFSFDHVEIRRRTGAATSELIETISAASIVQETQGVFYVDWAIPSDAEVGAYIDRWYFTLDSGDAVTSDDATFVVLAAGAFSGAPGYITVDEVRETYLPNSLLSDARISVLISEATEIIESTGRYFGGRSTSYFVDGTGEPWVLAPVTVQSLSAITIHDCDGSTRFLDPNDFALKGRWVIEKCYLPWPHSDARDGCVICGCPFGEIFPRGQKNIELEGVFGLYANVPALIKRAAGLLVMYGGQDPTRPTAIAFNHESESKEQYSWTRRATDSLDKIKLRGFTGIPEVDAILNRYRAIAGRMTVIR